MDQGEGETRVSVVGIIDAKTARHRHHIIACVRHVHVRPGKLAVVGRRHVRVHRSVKVDDGGDDVGQSGRD